MKAIIAVYIVALTCGFTHSSPYSAYNNIGGSTKRRNGSPMSYSQQQQQQQQQISPQYYDRVNSNSYLQPQAQQYLSNSYQAQPLPQQRIIDDYNYNRNYYYPSQQQQQQQQQQLQQQEPLYGYPTYHGDFNPKPYYFAQPSYMTQEDRLETTNPLDYLQAEIFQENERERNNAAFMQNLAFYNQKLDSLQARQQQLQQFENMYNLNKQQPSSEFDDYEMEQPSDWYDQTSILVDPNTFDNYLSSSEPQFQYQQWQPSDYDDEMVKELRDLKVMKQQKQQKGSKNSKKKSKQRKESFYHNGNLDWQRDMPHQQMKADNNGEEEVFSEPDNYDEEWINWGGEKRSIQPKKDVSDIKQAQQGPSSSTSTITPTTTSEKSKIVGKLFSSKKVISSGQKEVVLPRPATPVRRPFSEAVMKSMGKIEESQELKDQQALPIYKTIKQIIDMEQNLNHLSDNQLPTSKIRKRFVTNEETLAQQLNGLKRTSK